MKPSEKISRSCHDPLRKTQTTTDVFVLISGARFPILVLDRTRKLIHFREKRSFNAGSVAVLFVFAPRLVRAELTILKVDWSEALLMGLFTRWNSRRHSPRTTRNQGWTPIPGLEILEDRVLPIVFFFFTGPAGWLDETYRALLGRQIDPVGLADDTRALDGGISRTQIVTAIEDSNEYQVKFVNNLYFSLLGRAVDPTGLAMSLQILGGTPFLGGRPTVEQLKAIIISSPEYFAKHGSTDAGFQQGLYNDALGRTIDPSALINRSAQLAQGTSRYREALEVLTSTEAYGVLTENDYRIYLHREADAGSLAGWVSALSRGMRDEAMLASLIASDAFSAQTIIQIGQTVFV